MNEVIGKVAWEDIYILKKSVRHDSKWIWQTDIELVACLCFEKEEAAKKAKKWIKFKKRFSENIPTLQIGEKRDKKYYVPVWYIFPTVYATGVGIQNTTTWSVKTIVPLQKTLLYHNGLETTEKYRKLWIASKLLELWKDEQKWEFYERNVAFVRLYIKQWYKVTGLYDYFTWTVCRDFSDEQLQATLEKQMKQHFEEWDKIFVLSPNKIS